jgi:hypothetical protein
VRTTDTGIDPRHAEPARSGGSPAGSGTNAPSDTTPLATRVVLLTVLAVTAAALGWLALGGSAAIDPARASPVLWLFTVLFVLRVAGQLLVAFRPPKWLPPMGQWNLVPYPILLPIQLVLIVVMVWINVSLASDAGGATTTAAGLGRLFIGLSVVYALSMGIRYVVRMRRRPDQRWFGGTIPIVFHMVLASYLYVLGALHAAG